MYESIEHGRAVYLGKLRAYKEWIAARIGPARSWGGDAVLEDERWKACLAGMVEALGLTEEEDREIRQEAGFN